MGAYRLFRLQRLGHNDDDYVEITALEAERSSRKCGLMCKHTAMSEHDSIACGSGDLDEGNELVPTVGEQETGDAPPYEPSDEDKAIVEKAEASWARRKAVPPEQWQSTARRERFEGPPLGFDAEGDIAGRRPDDEQ